MDLCDVADLLDRQSGVVHRRQLTASGAQAHDIRRWLRRRDVSYLLPKVFVTHIGTPTRLQQWWAAVLWAEPAALALTTAVAAVGGRPTRFPSDPAQGSPVHLLIGRGRQLDPPHWIRTHCCQALDTSVLWAASPPRQREDESALDQAVAHRASGSRRSYVDSVAVLAEPIQGRRTTAPRLLAALDRRARVPHRHWLAGVIADIGAGTTTVLEHGYVHRVCRPHGLPPGLLHVRQQAGSGAVIRDVLLPGRIIELDGRAFHQGAVRRDQDLERDLDAAVGGVGTTRLGWGQIFDRPCQTARKLGILTSARPCACGPGCTAV